MIALAYVSPISVPQNPQAVLPLGDVSRSHEYFGRLEDFPHPYSFEVLKEQQFSASVFVPDEPQYANDVSLILVKAEKRGVSEVGRTSAKEATWQRERSVLFAETFRNGGTLSGALQPGSYIMEVSSPNNEGKYRLLWGQERVGRGYIGNVRALFEVKEFLGHATVGVFLSPLIYVPISLLVLAACTWWYRKLRTA
jgi:hypothetical protein